MNVNADVLRVIKPYLDALEARIKLDRDALEARVKALEDAAKD